MHVNANGLKKLWSLSSGLKMESANASETLFELLYRLYGTKIPNTSAWQCLYLLNGILSLRKSAIIYPHSNDRSTPSPSCHWWGYSALKPLESERTIAGYCSHFIKVTNVHVHLTKILDRILLQIIMLLITIIIYLR